MNQKADNGDLRVGGYHAEKLDDVSTRLARIEGKMESFATKEGLSNAKYSMMMSWIGLGIAILVGAASIILRVWPD